MRVGAAEAARTNGDGGRSQGNEAGHGWGCLRAGEMPIWLSKGSEPLSDVDVTVRGGCIGMGDGAVLGSRHEEFAVAAMVACLLCLAERCIFAAGRVDARPPTRTVRGWQTRRAELQRWGGAGSESPMAMAAAIDGRPIGQLAAYPWGRRRTDVGRPPGSWIDVGSCGRVRDGDAQSLRAAWHALGRVCLSLPWRAAAGAGLGRPRAGMEDEGQA